MKMTAPRVLENQEIPCGGYVQRGGGPQKTYCHNDGKKKILCVWHQELQDAENRGYDRAVDVHARSCGTQPPAIAAPSASDVEKAREIVGDHESWCEQPSETCSTCRVVAALAAAREETHDRLHADCLNERFAAGRIAGIEAAAKAFEHDPSTFPGYSIAKIIRALAEKVEK